MVITTPTTSPSPHDSGGASNAIGCPQCRQVARWLSVPRPHEGHAVTAPTGRAPIRYMGRKIGSATSVPPTRRASHNHAEVSS